MTDSSSKDKQPSSNGGRYTRDDLSDLSAKVYDELRTLAHQLIQNWEVGGTLQTTVLVHEAYLRLVNRPDPPFRDRAHFLRVAAKAMRSVLVDDVRRRCAGKRAEDQRKITYDSTFAFADGWNPDLLILDEVLDRLALFDARKAQVVELRFFGGCTFKETAELIGVSLATVKRDWSLAKAWLYREMYQGESGYESNP